MAAFSPLAGRRVLVAEDEAMIAMDLQCFLEEIGCVCVGPHGRLKEALDAAASSEIDCALIDLVLHDANSAAVLQILAERQIPFAMATAMPRSGVSPQWVDRPYLAKPYSRDDVRAVLDQMVGSAGGAKPVITSLSTLTDRVGGDAR